MLAAANRLIEALGVQMPTAAWSDERTRFKVNPIPPADLQENSMPLPAMGPPASASGTGAAPVASLCPPRAGSGKRPVRVKGPGVEFHALAGRCAVA